MLSASANPGMDNLAAILNVLCCNLGVTIEVKGGIDKCSFGALISMGMGALGYLLGLMAFCN